MGNQHGVGFPFLFTQDIYNKYENKRDSSAL